MSRVFISGSTTGLGLMAGELLASQSHRVVLHARNADRAEDARRALPKAEAVLVGDVETIAGAKDLASQANALGRFDAVTIPSYRISTYLAAGINHRAIERMC